MGHSPPPSPLPPHPPRIHLTSTSRPPHVHLASTSRPPEVIHVIRVPRPSLFCFFHRSSAFVYYTERKPKNKKQGSPGNPCRNRPACRLGSVDLVGSFEAYEVPVIIDCPGNHRLVLTIIWMSCRGDDVANCEYT